MLCMHAHALMHIHSHMFGKMHIYESRLGFKLLDQTIHEPYISNASWVMTGSDPRVGGRYIFTASEPGWGLPKWFRSWFCFSSRGFYKVVLPPVISWFKTTANYQYIYQKPKLLGLNQLVLDHVGIFLIWRRIYYSQQPLRTTPTDL